MHENSIQQGEIYWIVADALRPCVDGAAHPHVVIQDDLLNGSRIPTTVVCGISSNLKRAHEPGNVLLAPQEGGLPLASVVIVSQVSNVEKVTLTQPIGRLPVITEVDHPFSLKLTTCDFGIEGAERERRGC